MSVCMDCSSNFESNDGEKDFYIQRDLALPKRCQLCRTSRKQQINENDTVPDESNAFLSNIYCDNCGREAKVPFKPQSNRKAYCRVCWNGVKNVGVTAEFV